MLESRRRIDAPAQAVVSADSRTGHGLLILRLHDGAMAKNADNSRPSGPDPREAPRAPIDPAGTRKGVDPGTAARANKPTKPAVGIREEQLLKHNPGQGTPSIRRNPEAGKPKEQRTNRGAKLPHDAPDSRGS